MVAHEEQVDVNFVKNNFNNNAYRNNFGNNNYKPYPSNNGNPYGNYNGNFSGNAKTLSNERIFEVEKATKNFMQTQYEQNKSFMKQIDEHSFLLKNISQQLEGLNTEISNFQVRLSNTETYISNMSEAQSSLINKMAAKPKSTEIAEISKVANICTIFTNEDIKILNAQESSTEPKYANGKRIGVGKFLP